MRNSLTFARFCAILRENYHAKNVQSIYKIMGDLTDQILKLVKTHSEGVSLNRIATGLKADISRRSLQYKLSKLVQTGKIKREGEGRGAFYRYAGEDHAVDLLISDKARAAYDYVKQHILQRKPVGYVQSFLDDYIPNKSFYLDEEERNFLEGINTRHTPLKDADTYRKTITERLLIDLSWNSSRLEGNTYSLLDTKRLLEFGERASDRSVIETQMILNHKEAISFLIRNEADTGLNRRTVLNSHALLSQGLLPDPAASGRLRHISVGIENSAFIPLEVPQRIEDNFNQILEKAGAIENPFEASLFLMTHIPYLQPFDDVNKRLSRIIANLPFIQCHLSPLSFTDVPKELYIAAVLAVYELNNIDLLKDLFIKAYERSAQKYAAIKQSVGEPDPFRIKHYQAMREIISQLIIEKINRSEALTFIRKQSESRVDKKEREKFLIFVEEELAGLHEGNFARFRVTPNQFEDWEEIWRHR